MEEVAVRIDENRCKSCNVCVSVCPSGALAMVEDAHAIQGVMARVVHAQACIGCRECELRCPDFAIFVAEKGFKFAKLTPESRARAEAIKANNFRLKEGL